MLSGRAPRYLLQRRGVNWIADLFIEVENRWPAWVEVDGLLENGTAIAGLEVHAAPGHTEGSVFYWHAASATVATGDTLVTAVPPLTFRRGLRLAYPAFAVDGEQAHASLRAFHRDGPRYAHVLPGHGPPLLVDARAQVDRLLERHPEPPLDAARFLNRAG